MKMMCMIPALHRTNYIKSTTQYTAFDLKLEASIVYLLSNSQKEIFFCSGMQFGIIRPPKALNY